MEDFQTITEEVVNRNLPLLDERKITGYQRVTRVIE